MRRPKVAFVQRIIQGLPHLFHSVSRRREAGAEGRDLQAAHSAGASSFQSPPGSTLLSEAIRHEPQNYYDLAQRYRQLLSLKCIWLGPDDVQITGTTAFSSGGFSEVWRGSLQGRDVVVKSFRCYSSPEFDPAEIGIVSPHRSPISAVGTTLISYSQRFLKVVLVSSQLSHPNLVPFVGVYSTSNHPFALVYAMMHNLELGQYLANHPNTNRLKLVSTMFTIPVADPWPTHRFSSSSGFHARWNTCTARASSTETSRW